MKKSFGKHTSASLLRSVDRTVHEPELTPVPLRTPTNEAPTCESCATDEYLVYDEITLQLDARGIVPPAWDIEYWCGCCESVYGILTTYMSDDGPAMRLAAANPRVVEYPSAAQAGGGTKVDRDARTLLSPGTRVQSTDAVLHLTLGNE